MDKVVIGYARFVTRFHWLVLLISLAIGLSLLSGGRFLQFTNDYRYFFSEDNPNLTAWDLVQRTYTKSDTLLWIIRPNEGEVTDPRILKIIGEATERAWQTPYSLRVDSLTNFQHTHADEDDLYVGDLVPDPENVSAEEAASIKSIALAEPLLVSRVIAPDARTTAVMATLQMAEDDVVASAQAMAHARALKSDLQAAYPDVEIALTGSVTLSNAFSESSQGDLKTLVPIMLAVIGLTIFILTRSITGTASSLGVVLLSAGSAMGLASYLGVKISPPSAGAPTVILTIAVADAIHLLVTTLIVMRQGRSKVEAIVESLRVNMAPVFLTSLTTAIGFLSLNFSDAPPMRDLGNIAAVGAMLAWFFSITLFPALLALFPLKASATIESQSTLMEKIAGPIIALRFPIMLIFVGFVGASAIAIPKLQFNDRFVEYFDYSTEFRRDTEFAIEHLTGIYQINYSINAADSGGIADPDYLRRVDQFAEWSRQQPEVMNVASFTDIMKRLNKNMHGDDPSYYRTPDDRDLAAQYLLLYEMSLPYGLDLNDQLNVDKSASRVIVTLDNISTNEMAALRARTQTWFDVNFPTHMHAAPAGQAVMFSFIGRNNFEAMKAGAVFALVMITICLFIALRNLRLSALSIIPNVTPPILAFGIYFLFVKEVGFWSTFVGPAALGLIVDATVHFLSKYRRARVEHGHDAKGGVRYAFSTVGTALLVSTLVLVAGFSVLALSAWRINAMLGIMVALTIGVALIVDFLLLPALLVSLDGRKKAATPA